MDFWDHKHWRDIHQNDPYANVPKVMTPHLVKHVLPNIKLILLLREPAERYFFLIRFLLVLSIFTFKFSKIYLSTHIWLVATGQVWVEGQDSYQIFLTSNLKSEQTFTIGGQEGRLLLEYRHEIYRSFVPYVYLHICNPDFRATGPLWIKHNLQTIIIVQSMIFLGSNKVD